MVYVFFGSGLTSISDFKEEAGLPLSVSLVELLVLERNRFGAIKFHCLAYIFFLLMSLFVLVYIRGIQRERCVVVLVEYFALIIQNRVTRRK